jgi:N6-adenosine-specific RNA methylase IME4
MANVSRKMVERALRVRRSSPLVAEAVANGRIPTMRVAMKLANLPPTIQQSVLADESSGSALKRQIHSAFTAWKSAQPIQIPLGRFNVIVADPAWPVDKAPYLTMPLNQIEEDLRQLLENKADKNCHLFLWTTQAHLFDAGAMIGHWGWQYKFTMTWRKTNGPQNPSGPMYTEEFVIVATKGSPEFIDIRDFKTGFEGKKRLHSQKPDEFFETIRRATAGRRLELFARQTHAGFEPHGNEIERSTPTESTKAVDIRRTATDLSRFRKSSLHVSVITEWIGNCLGVGSDAVGVNECGGGNVQ